MEWVKENLLFEDDFRSKQSPLNGRSSIGQQKSGNICIVKSLAQSTILSYTRKIEMDMKQCMPVGGGILLGLARFTVV